MPVELVLGQSLGDLFVIRVAGNVAQPSQIGSVEFAVERFGTRLVVVMGHTECGAVTSAVEELLRPTAARSMSLRAIVDLIRPAVEPLVERFRSDPTALVQGAIRANIAASIEALREGSPLLRQMMSNGLSIVGAEYELATGVVTFFDGAEEPV